jgi:hypothetical protein
MALLILVMVLTTFPDRSYAAASTSTVNQTIPVDFTIFVPCAAGGAGELVQLTGTVHQVFVMTSDGSGGLHVEAIINPQGLSGIGLTTGDTYRGNGTTTSHFTLTSAINQTYVNKLVMIGPGPGNNFLVRETFHFTLNANGEFSVFFDKFSVECK